MQVACDQMKKTILLTSFICLLLFSSLVLSADNFKASLTKESYYSGEDVSVIIDVTNPNQQKTVINWYIIITPALSEHPVTIVGGKTFAPKEHFSNVYKTKAEKTGDFNANVKFVDSNDKIIQEKNLTFSVKSNFWPYLISIPIILVIMFLVYFKYKRKSELRVV